MKLHVVAGSPSSLKALAVVERLGTPIELVTWDFFGGALHSPAYLALNANAKVPTLEDGGTRIFESNAIVQYLADRDEDRRLYPREPAARAAIHQWLAWELAHYNQALGTYVWETIAKPQFMDQPSDEAVAGWARGNLLRFAAVLDGALAERDFLLGGDTPSLADYAVGHLEGFVGQVAFDWSPFPRVTAWYERVRTDPAWTRARARLG